MAEQRPVPRGLRGYWVRKSRSQRWGTIGGVVAVVAALVIAAFFGPGHGSSTSPPASTPTPTVSAASAHR